MYLHTSWLNNGGSYKTDSLSHIYCFQCALTKLRCIAETLLFVIILLSCNYPSHTWMHSSCLTSVCLSAPRLFISRYLMNFLQSRLWNTYLIQSETLKLSATAALDRLSSQFVFLSCYLMLCLQPFLCPSYSLLNITCGLGIQLNNPINNKQGWFQVAYQGLLPSAQQSSSPQPSAQHEPRWYGNAQVRCINEGREYIIFHSPYFDLLKAVDLIQCKVIQTAFNLFSTTIEYRTRQNS